MEVVDLSDPRSPVHAGETGSVNAFALAASQNYLFVADGAGGLGVMDLSDPVSPTFLASRPTTGLAVDVAIKGNYAYVAVGSGGMDIFDITNPAAPVFAANYHVDGFTNHLSVDGERAYLANWETVEIVDISEPTEPELVATQHSFERAMAVAVGNGTFYVGDWATFRIYDYLDSPAPDINADPIEISFGTVPVGEAQTLSVFVENLGQLPLTISGLSAVGSGFSVASAAFTLDAFESREIPVTFQPSSTSRVSGFISIRSDDPDEAEKIVPLTGGDRTVGVGDLPPDFTLVDTQGKSYHLQEFIDQGQIIIIAMFASW